MKTKYLLLFLLLLPFAANATLLGRVNAYYSAKTTEEVEKAIKAHDEALEALDKAKKALETKQAIKPPVQADIDKANADIDNANTKVASTFANLELAKKKMPLGWTNAENDQTGVKEGAGPVSLTTVMGKEVTAVEFNAYKLNLLMPWKANCKKKKAMDKDGNPIMDLDGNPEYDKDANGKPVFERVHAFNFSSGQKKCDADDISGFRFVPVYFFLHAPANQQVSKDTVIYDLLDNEHGVLVNVKLTPSLFSFSATDNDGNSLPSGVAGIFDLGAKYMAAPSKEDPAKTAYVGAGYFGLGFNFEFGMYDGQQSMKAVMDGTVKPAGAMAIGFGAYKNWVDSRSFDNSAFAADIPIAYDTYVLGYEFQVTGQIAISGTRSIPTKNNSLGTYSAVSMKYNF